MAIFISFLYVYQRVHIPWVHSMAEALSNISKSWRSCSLSWQDKSTHLVAIGEELRLKSMEIDGRYLHFRILKFPLMKCPDPKFVESTVLLLGGAITMLKNMSSSMGRIIPHIYIYTYIYIYISWKLWKNKSHIPNHQPDNLLYIIIHLCGLSEAGDSLRETQFAAVSRWLRNVMPNRGRQSMQMATLGWIPSGERLHSNGKSPFLMGKSTINSHFPLLC